MVPCGFKIACRRASCPTRRSPASVNATTDGVVRDPSALGITVGFPASVAAITELVVPRSIPTATAMTTSHHHYLRPAPGHGALPVRGPAGRPGRSDAAVRPALVASSCGAHDGGDITTIWLSGAIGLITQGQPRATGLGTRGGGYPSPSAERARPGAVRGGGVPVTRCHQAPTPAGPGVGLLHE